MKWSKKELLEIGVEEELIELSQRKKKEYGIEEIKKNPYNLEYADETLKNNKEVVMQAVSKLGVALKYASEQLRSDKEVVRTAVSEYWSAIRYADESLRNDKEIGLIVTKGNGEAFVYLSDSLKKDKDIILNSVKDYPSAINYVEFELLYDDQFMAKIKEINNSAYLRGIKIRKPEIEQFIAFNRDDKINNNSDNLNIAKYRKEKYKKEKEYIKKEWRKHIGILNFASEQLKNDKNFMLSIIELNSCGLKYCSRELQLNKSFVLDAIRIHEDAVWSSEDLSYRNAKYLYDHPSPSILLFIDKSLREDEDILLTYLYRNRNDYTVLTENLWKNKDLIKKIIKMIPDYKLDQMDNSLKDDREFMHELIEISGETFKYVGDSLKKDEELAYLALEKTNYALFDYLIKNFDESIIKDKEIVEKALSYDEYYFNLIDDSLKKDKELVKNLLTTKPSLYYKLDETLKRDKEVALIAVHANNSVFKDLIKEFRKDKEIILEALRFDDNLNSWYYGRGYSMFEEMCSIFNLIDITLRKDKIFIKEIMRDNSINLFNKKQLLTVIDESILDEEFVNYLEYLPYDLYDDADLYLHIKKLEDMDLLKEIIRKNPYLMRFNKSIIEDKEFIFDILQHSGYYVFCYLDENLKYDKNFISYFINRYNEIHCIDLRFLAYFVSFISEFLINNRDVAYSLLDLSGEMIFAMDKQIIDKGFILRAIHSTPDLYLYSEIFNLIDNEMKKDKQFLIDIIKQEPHWLDYFDEEIKNCEEIVLAAIEEDPTAFDFASEQLKHNSKIRKALYRKSPEIYECLCKHHK